MNKAIEDSVNDGIPFFAYMTHYAVHAPFQTDSRFAANYPTLSSNALAFATMVEGMDKSLIFRKQQISHLATQTASWLWLVKWRSNSMSTALNGRLSPHRPTPNRS